jgi:hypothetical protein
MRRALLISTALLACISSAAHAQVGRPVTELSASLGGLTRKVDGNSQGGFSFALALVPASKARFSWEVGLEYHQVSVNGPPAAAGADSTIQKENSLDIAGRIRASLVSGPVWSLEAAAGPVVSLALGCTGGGTNGALYGATNCVNSFANNGTHIGVDLHARSLWTVSRNARLFLSVTGATATTAAGNGTVYGANAGLRVALNH